MNHEQIIKLLGHNPGDREVNRCLQAIEIIEPATGSLCWRSQDSDPGVYTILQGKARLINKSEDLITFLSPGSTFGELTWYLADRCPTVKFG
jgi:CRP-like cAMP-binding protein